MFRWFLLVVVVFTASLVKGEDITAAFICDFEEDNCGITSQEGLTAQWVRKKLEIAGRTGYVMVLEPKGDNSQVGRLLTPIFEIGREMNGCVEFDLHMSGEGAVALYLEKHTDSGFEYIHSVKTTAKGWRKNKIDVSLEDSVQFLFEAHVYPKSGSSTIALDDFAFRLNKCSD